MAHILTSNSGKSTLKLKLNEEEQIKSFVHPTLMTFNAPDDDPQTFYLDEEYGRMFITIFPETAVEVSGTTVTPLSEGAATIIISASRCKTCPMETAHIDVIVFSKH